MGETVFLVEEEASEGFAVAGDAGEGADGGGEASQGCGAGRGRLLRGSSRGARAGWWGCAHRQARLTHDRGLAMINSMKLVVVSGSHGLQRMRPALLLALQIF
jgi:hypothetical protein